MPAIRTNPEHCWDCRRQRRTEKYLMNGLGWIDLCQPCGDEEEFPGPARAYTGSFPVTAEMRMAGQ